MRSVKALTAHRDRVRPVFEQVELLSKVITGDHPKGRKRMKGVITYVLRLTLAGAAVLAAGFFVFVAALHRSPPEVIDEADGIVGPDRREGTDQSCPETSLRRSGATVADQWRQQTNNTQ